MLSAGSQVGYTFALNNTTALSVAGESDGNGGTQNVSINVAEDIEGPSTTIFDSVQDHIPISALEFNNVTLNGNNGLSGGSTSLGGNITVGISGTLSLDSDLEAINGETIYSESNTHVPQTILENDSLSVAGNSVSLGGSTTISLADLSTFDLSSNDLIDGTNTVYDAANTQVPLSILEATEISISGNDGLNGGTAILGNSISVGIAGTLSLDADLEAVNGETIYDESNTQIVESILPSISNSTLTNSSITVNGNSVALGGSTSINLNLNDDEERLFGSNTDISLRFDSANDSFRIQDNINGVDIVDVDRTTGDVSISGTLTEGAAL